MLAVGRCQQNIAFFTPIGPRKKRLFPRPEDGGVCRRIDATYNADLMAFFLVDILVYAYGIKPTSEVYKSS